jgi:hypothetical protein
VLIKKLSFLIDSDAREKENKFTASDGTFAQQCLDSAQEHAKVEHESSIVPQESQPVRAI